jgi:hypothetical protein
MNLNQGTGRGANAAVPNSVTNAPGTARGTGLVPKPSAPQTGQYPQLRPTNRPSSPGIATPPQGPTTRPSSPVITPSQGTTRASTPPVTTPAAGSRVPSSPRQPTPALGVPQRPTSDGERRLTPQAGIPTQPRPTSPQGIARPVTPSSVNPPTLRYSSPSASSSSSMPQAGGGDEDAEFRHAMSLLTSKDWSAARLAFHALAAKVPQSRPYRALLCYARGRETQATGRNDDAAMEFQRALQLDPDLQLAKDALRELGRKSRF